MTHAKKTWPRIVLPLLLVLLGTAAISGCGGGTDATTSTLQASISTVTTSSSAITDATTQASTTGAASDKSPAPDFSGTTIQGRQVSLESYRGKPLVLVFWSSG